MPKYAAFLRAINIGGRRITNDELRTTFEGLGFNEVAVWRASGNVIFAAGARSPGSTSLFNLAYYSVSEFRAACEASRAERTPDLPVHGPRRLHRAHRRAGRRERGGGGHPLLLARARPAARPLRRGDQDDWRRDDGPLRRAPPRDRARAADLPRAGRGRRLPTGADRSSHGLGRLARRRLVRQRRERCLAPVLGGGRRRRARERRHPRGRRGCPLDGVRGASAPLRQERPRTCGRTLRLREAVLSLRPAVATEARQARRPRVGSRRLAAALGGDRLMPRRTRNEKQAHTREGLTPSAATVF